MKLYIVIWKGSKKDSWHVDGLYTDERIAQARLTLEELEHPSWKHALVVADAPEEAVEQAA